MKNNVYILFLLLSLSCKKKEIGPQCPSCSNTVASTDYSNILIGCEGNFGWGNASLSVFNPNDNTISNQVFQSKNGFAIGDVLQDIAYNTFDSNYYLSVNNSGKLIVIDTNYNYLYSINGFTSPRYISFINNTKAYVSDLYANALSIINLQAHSIQGNIGINGWSEHMMTIDSVTWVAIEDSNQIIRVNNITDQIIDTIIVSKGPNSIIHQNQSVWVLCDGGLNQDTAALYELDLQGVPIHKFSFNSTQDNPTALQVSSTGDLFYLNQGVYKVTSATNTLPSTPFITDPGLFYNLVISPMDEIYITNAIDYVQPGKLYRYDINGNLTSSNKTGIIPNDICFRP